MLAGAPFANGADTPVFADFKTKVDKLTIAEAEKARLIAAAREALTGPFQRGYRTMLATWDALEPQARRQPRRLGPAGRRRLLRQPAQGNRRLRIFGADQIHQIGLDQVARIHREMERIKSQVGFKGTLQQFFAHINGGQRVQISQHRSRPAAISRRRHGASSPR